MRFIPGDCLAIDSLAPKVSHMVWLELVIASKSASVFAPAAVKLASASSSATVAAAATPDLGDVSQFTSIENSLYSFGDELIKRVLAVCGNVCDPWSRVAALGDQVVLMDQVAEDTLSHTVHTPLLWSDTLSTVSGPVCFTASALYVLRRCGYFQAGREAATEDADGLADDGERIPNSRASVWLSSCMFAVAAADCLLAAAVVQSWDVRLDVPLRTWAVGGLLLSYPSTTLVAWVAKRDGFRTAFALDLGLTATSCCWLAWGQYLLSSSRGLADGVPMLYWICFGTCAFNGTLFACGVGFEIVKSACQFVLAMRAREHTNQS